MAGEFWRPPPPKNRPPLSQRRRYEIPVVTTPERAQDAAESALSVPPDVPNLSLVRGTCCPECGLAPDGPVVARVRADLDALGELRGVEPSLAALALVLATQVDEGVGEDGRLLPALTKELRAVLAEVRGTRTHPSAPDHLPTVEPPSVVPNWDDDLDQPV